VTLTADPARRTERTRAAAQANLEAGALIAEDDAVCEATGASAAPYPAMLLVCYGQGGRNPPGRPFSSPV
jgi:hypothetical protein